MRESNIDLGNLTVHMIEAGPADGPSFLFIHGWPQSSHAFEPVMTELADSFRVAAIDLPGVGRSRGLPPGADKRTLARCVNEIIKATDLIDVTLTGHDVGGQIVYAYLRAFPETIKRAAIFDVAVPGVDPWPKVVGNPRIWHFGFHAVPDLPELLVSGHVAEYFDFFFNVISADPAAIGPEARRIYAEAYGSAESLRAGFDWYRTFPRDERDNIADASTPVSIPVLYVRGDAEGGKLKDYIDCFKKAGLVNIEGELIADCGHFSPEEQPKALAAILRSFAQKA
jgi:pimeloyl-ACP methyl ester carboxylesterase